MTKYSYIAKGNGKERIQDYIEAASRYNALELLHNQGVTVISLSENGTHDHDAADMVIMSRRRPFMGVALGEKAIFFRQLAIAMGAGVPLREALQSISKDVTNKIFKFTLKDTISKIYDGASFSEAMAHHPHIFDQSTIALIAAAEESGNMEETLERLATSLEQRSNLQRKIRSILAYPMFVMFFFVIVCVIINAFVMPQFQEVFRSFEAKLPLITRVVFGINTFLLKNSIWILLVNAMIIVGLWLYGRTPNGQRVYDRIKLGLPLFGKCIHKLLVARICRSLSMMIRGGVPIAYAIELTAAVSGNMTLRKAMMDVHDKVVNGMSLSESIGVSWLFPNLVSRMVSVGESSGKLPQVLDKVGETYENEVEGSIMVAMALFEPIIIVVFGAIILVLVMAVYMPVFSVASGVK